MKPLMNTDAMRSSSELENAFLMFNKLSERLTGSYQELEVKVAQMTRELAYARDERLAELAQKKVLAERLELLLDTLPAGVLVVDKRGDVIQANPVAHQMLGEDLVGSSWIDIARQTFGQAGEEIRLHDGRWVNVAITPLETDAGKLVLITDVSETRALQTFINRQQRLTSLGEMVASIAHQLRTPLASALLYISNLSHPFTRDSDRTRIAGRARDRLQHLERMVNDMLVFARGEVSVDEKVDLGQLIERLADSMLDNGSLSTIQITFEKYADNIHVRANSDALYSMLQNITDNAVQACQAKRVDGEDECIAIQIFLSMDASGYAVIEIVDNGTGMSAQTIDRVAEPFYTTRQQGTGLGVAVVNAILDSLGGGLEIESLEGVGTSVTMKIPIAEHTRMMSSELANSAKLSR